MGCLLLLNSDSSFLRLYFVCSVCINIDGNKRGQTSRLVAGAQIQTSCNFEKNEYNCDRFLDFVHRWCIYYYLESIHFHMVSIHCCSFVSSHHNLRLHKNFLYSASSPNSFSEPRCSRTTEPSNSTKHSSIQKGSLQCTVGAGNNGCLLSAVYYSGRLDASKRDTYIRISCLAFYGYLSLLKLVFKSLAVLLEDQ